MDIEELFEIYNESNFENDIPKIRDAFEKKHPEYKDNSRKLITDKRITSYIFRLIKDRDFKLRHLDRLEKIKGEPIFTGDNYREFIFDGPDKMENLFSYFIYDIVHYEVRGRIPNADPVRDSEEVHGILTKYMPIFIPYAESVTADICLTTSQLDVGMIYYNEIRDTIVDVIKYYNGNPFDDMLEYYEFEFKTRLEFYDRLKR